MPLLANLDGYAETVGFVRLGLDLGRAAKQCVAVRQLGVRSTVKL